MRDIEKLQQTRDYRLSGGQLRVLLLGVLAASCAIFALGVSVGKRFATQAAAPAHDPLVELTRSEQPQGNAEPAEAPAPRMTYHGELTTAEGERPGGQLASDDQEVAAGQDDTSSPAASSAGDQGAQRAQAVRSEPPTPDEPRPGEASVFTLQVASFETREEAEQFATGLRTHGHRTFLVRTRTEDRGTWYRVRVGPFDNRRDALRYQTRFERQERLPTFLVQRRPRQRA